MTQSNQPIDYRKPGTPMNPDPIIWPKGIEWLWWGLLAVSICVGFGMTIFAPN